MYHSVFLKHVFEGDEPDEDFVKKEDFEEALLNMREILLLYNIKPEELNQELLHMSTAKPGFVSLKEAGEFLMSDRPPIKIKLYDNKGDPKKRRVLERPQGPTSTLSEEKIKIFRDLFLEIDTFGEMKISLKQMIHKIRNDARTRDWIE